MAPRATRVWSVTRNIVGQSRRCEGDERTGGSMCLGVQAWRPYPALGASVVRADWAPARVIFKV